MLKTNAETLNTLKEFLTKYVENIDVNSEFIDEAKGQEMLKAWTVIFGSDPYESVYISDNGDILI